MLKVYETSGKLLFEEKQKFPNWIFLLVLLITTSGVVITVIAAIAEGTASGMQGLWLALAIMIPLEAIMVYIFYTVRLEKVVTSNGLYFRWPPLQKKYSVLEVEMIEKVESRKAPMQYGAKWIPGYGKVHNLSRQGVQCYLVSGKKMFFGTGEPAEFQKAVEQMLDRNRKSHFREF